MKVRREKISVDNWGSVQYHDENTILMLNRSHIQLLDRRVSMFYFKLTVFFCIYAYHDDIDLYHC